MTGLIERPPFVLACTGTSLTTGYLSADWVPRLNARLPQEVEAVGPVTVINRGSGGQTSIWGRDRAAPLISPLRPTHVLMEGFGINDCALTDGVSPQVSRPDHIANIISMIDTFRTVDPDVDITLHTMSPVPTAGAALRPALADYYDDEMTTAIGQGIRVMNHYADWPQPLPREWTYSEFDPLGDALHPVWDYAAITTPGYMTNNVIPSNQVITRSSGTQGYLVFDGNDYNNWSVNTDLETETGWVQRQWLDGARRWTRYSIFSTVAAESIRTWQLLGSNDGSSWTILDTQNLMAPFGQSQLYFFDIRTPGNFTYYRLNVLNIFNVAGGNRVRVAELRFYALAAPPVPVVAAYLYPGVLAFAKARMAEFWGLT